ASGFNSGSPAELAPIVQRRGAPILVVAGSRHPKTIAQVNRLISERTVTPIEITVGVEEQRKQEWIASTVGALAAGRSVVIRAPVEEIRQGSAQRTLVELLGGLTARVCREVALG